MATKEETDDPDLSRFRLTRPCRHCPFGTSSEAIRFANRERAEEIEEQAYRTGFPCHETADYTEDPLTGEGGYVFGDETSYCIGYVILRLKSDGGAGHPWPAIGNDEELLERLAAKLGDWWRTNVFEDEEAYYRANSRRDETREAQGEVDEPTEKP